jgi:hypothetical protein
VRPHLALLIALSAGCSDYSVFDPSRLASSGETPTLATPRRTDVVVQQMPDKVDVLWIIDNSGSMSQEQEKIATQFDAFAQFFIGSGLDWHMGVITTDSEDGLQNGLLRQVAGLHYLTDDTPHPQEIFAQMARVGTWGSSDEMGLQTMWNAVTLPSGQHQTWNAGFLRDDASLHVVIVGDEDDQSDRATTEYASMLLALKPNADTPVTFNAIVGPKPTGCRGATGDAAPGYRFIEVAQAVGGQIYSICQDDWVPVLQALGLAAAGLREEYFLSELPVPGTIDILVQDRQRASHGIDLASVPAGEPLDDACVERDFDHCFYFDYDSVRNSIRTVGWMPGPKSKISITYDLLKAANEQGDLPTGGGADTDVDTDAP